MPVVWNNGISNYVELSHPDERIIYMAIRQPSDPEGVLLLTHLDIRTRQERTESYAKHGGVWIELLPEDGGPKVFDPDTPEYEAFEALLKQPAVDVLEYGRQVLRQEGVLQ